ncbi:MAG: nucleotidyltransferase domain-containing protein [Ferroplasma sp.]
MPIEYEIRRYNYLKNYKEVVRSVYNIARSIDKDSRIFVFGSVISGKITNSSDVDILILGHNRKLYNIMYIKILKNVDAPIELHFVDEDGFKWYSKMASTIQEYP